MATHVVVENGSVVLPDDLKELLGIEEGSVLLAEAREDGIVLRSSGLPAVEIYTPERIAEFLLSNSMDAEDYADAVAEVRSMGLDPESIDHYRPGQPAS